jgi:hypothetical protein
LPLSTDGYCDEILDELIALDIALVEAEDAYEGDLNKYVNSGFKRASPKTKRAWNRVAETMDRLADEYRGMRFELFTNAYGVDFGRVAGDAREVTKNYYDFSTNRRERIPQIRDRTRMYMVELLASCVRGELP